MNTRLGEKSGTGVKGLWQLCPVRHTLLLVSLAVTGLYFALRSNRALMIFLSGHIARPWHNMMSRLLSPLRFSAAELLYCIVTVALIAYIIISVTRVVRGPNRVRQIFLALETLVCVGLVAYAGMCLLWGVYYYGESFSERAGIETRGVSTQELETVTAYFASIANTYALQVSRDENGVFNVDRGEILDLAPEIYREVSVSFPALEGAELRPKPFEMSKILSYLNFTGFFFPLTGEANLNMDSPASMLASTAAHELAHQRGVAMEQEANFVAVLASMESKNPIYCYSSALLAYIHLGNALYSADYDAWLRIYEGLAPEVLADLGENNEYWKKYETKVSDVSETVYTGFLQSHGQTLGLKSYGACIDLLIAYYYDTAAGEP